MIGTFEHENTKISQGERKNQKNYSSYLFEIIPIYITGMIKWKNKRFWISFRIMCFLFHP